jgi:hemolysin activation/secretion protein
MRILVLMVMVLVADSKLSAASDIRVGQCVVFGSTLLSDEAIKGIVTPIIESGSHPTSCLQASQVLETALRKAGAFAARVFIDVDKDPPTIMLHVVEGRLAKDGIKLGRPSSRVDDQVIQAQTAATLEPGSTLTADKYERAILLLNDLPGIKGSENALFPSDAKGEANFEIYPHDGKLVEGHVFTDNFGSTSTGEYRVGTVVDINSPFRQGEKFTVGANVSELGTYYLSIDASMPLSDTGLRGGIAIAALQYRTDEDDDLRGYSREASAFFSYPLIRSRQTSLYGEARVGREAMKDVDDTSTVTDRYVDTVHLKLSGEHLDDFLGGSTNSFSIEGVVGHLDLGAYEPYRLEDQTTARTNGKFSRLTWSVSRLQHITGPWQSYVELAGQFASKRLDSSQSISFGGPYDFPGYKSGEVLGDTGLRLHADLRYNVPENVLNSRLQVSVFYNVGEITSHAKSISGNVITSGVDTVTYTLQSAGIGLRMAWSDVTLHGAVGRRFSNEIPDNLLDGDAGDDFHGWFQLIYNF